MSVTIDANVLLYASDAHSPRHRSARDLLERLAAGPGLVYVFWPVAMAYLRIATHPRIFENPSIRTLREPISGTCSTVLTYGAPGKARGSGRFTKTPSTMTSSVATWSPTRTSRH